MVRPNSGKALTVVLIVIVLTGGVFLITKRFLNIGEADIREDSMRKASVPSGTGTITTTKECQRCYIELKIEEKVVKDIWWRRWWGRTDCSGDPTINFSLLRQKNLYGHYKGLVNTYYSTGDYLLKVYDNSDNLINTYSLYSGRFILYDNFEPDGSISGGRIEFDSGSINAVIPYAPNIAKITVAHNEKETDLEVNPSEFQCKRKCKIEGKW